jgi:hypothetical protein
MASAVVRPLLSVARGIIHNEHLLDNHPETFRSALVKAGIVLPAASLISSEEVAVVEEAVALLVEVLDGRNKEGQDALLNHFIAMHDETFFVNVSDIIKDDVEEIQEVITYIRTCCFLCSLLLWPD